MSRGASQALPLLGSVSIPIWYLRTNIERRGGIDRVLTVIGKYCGMRGTLGCLALSSSVIGVVAYLWNFTAKHEELLYSGNHTIPYQLTPVAALYHF
jgi:hypothetical protein